MLLPAHRMHADHADYSVWVAAMTGTDGPFDGKRHPMQYIHDVLYVTAGIGNDRHWGEPRHLGRLSAVNGLRGYRAQLPPAEQQALLDEGHTALEWAEPNANADATAGKPETHLLRGDGR